MRNKHAILTIFFYHLLTTGLMAQVVSKDNFNRAVDYVNCKLAEFSLKNAGDNNLFNSFQQNCDCENPDVLKIKEQLKDAPKTLGLFIEIDNYKKAEYKEKLTVQDASKIILINMFLDSAKYNKAFEFHKKNISIRTFNELEAELKIHISAFFNPDGASTNGVVQDMSTDNDSVEGNTFNGLQEFGKKGISGTWLPYLMLLLASILLNTVLFLVFGVPMIQRKMQQVMNKERNDRALGSSGLENRIENLDARYGQLNNDFLGLRRDIKDLQRVESKSTNNLSHESFPPTPIEEVLYFSSPNAEGIFASSHGSTSFQEGKSIYKFVKIASNRAQFRIDNRDIATKLALRSLSNITPVCTSENDFNTSFTRITTIKEGIAELEGDKWVVKSNNKAIIRYEY